MSEGLTERVLAWRERGQETEFGGHHVHVFAREGAGPTLLLLHGFPSSSYDWRLLIDLEPNAAVLAPDFLGYGFSDKPSEHHYTMVEAADLAEQVVRRHTAAGPVFIVGHDIGQTVSSELLARDIDGSLGFEVAGVLLLNGSTIQEAATATLGQRLLRGRLGPVAARLGTGRFFRAQFASLFSEAHPLSDEEADDQWALYHRAGGNRLGHRLIRYMDERMERAERWRGAIRDWPGSLSLAWGMVDPVATPNVLVAMRELRPAAPVTEWEDLGHYPAIEDPGRVADALRAALDAA